MKLFLLLSLQICLLLPTVAQNRNQQLTDSLLTALKNDKADTSKVNNLNELAFIFKNNNPDTAIYYANAALQKALKCNYPFGVANSRVNLASAKISIGEYDAAYSELNIALKIYDEILASTPAGEKERILKQQGRASSIAGNTMVSKGNYPEALKYYGLALKIREEIDDKAGIANIYNNMGSVYVDEGNFVEALKNNLAALKIRIELDDKDGIAASYNNIGNVYDALGNYTEALKMHFAALKIRKINGDKKGISSSYNNIGGIYNIQGKYYEALENLNASLAISEEIGDQKSIANTYLNIGGVYEHLNNYSAAINHYEIALQRATAIGDKLSASYSNISLGALYLKQKKFALSESYLNNGLNLSKEIGVKGYVLIAYQNLSTLDSIQGNFKQALGHFQLYIAYRDSIYNEANTKKTVQTQMQFEFDNKEAALKAAQDKKDAIAAAEIKTQRSIRNFILFGFACALLFTIVVYRQRNRIAKEKMRSDQLVQDKEMLIKEIHHRVKNNLEVISSLLELQSEGIFDSKAKAAIIEGQSRVQSIALIHHKLYRNDDVSTVEFKSFVTELYKQVSDVFKENGTTIEFINQSEETPISIDTAVPLGLILNELLTNTFKYAVQRDRQNSIIIRLEKPDASGFHKFIYQDNGPGLPEHFDISTSTSLGMKVIQLLTRQLGGALRYYNDHGSIFEIPFKPVTSA